ncbi:MAG: hypothetical protein FWD73_17950 [Polyangiaceae bacterium]|nr:hypothetical protein [Polyangiaceae bacterium]
MAIELTLNLAEEALNEEMVLKGIHELGFTSTVEVPTEDRVFHCDSCYDTLGFQVTLVKSMGSPTNVLKIRLLGEGERAVEFEFRQFLSFRFDKEIELKPALGRAVRMIFRLMSHVRAGAYLETGDCAEVYFFNEDKSVLVNKSSSIGHIIDIKKEFSDWKVIEVAM